MIPVSLRLQNFLSYGSDTEALDFTQFSVACLSGANGQGKSALLDGITWALWGQARKSSHSRKPDAELLRIGAQEMRVEYVFDIEGERYRAERFFAQSASGKTSKSGLELAIFDGTDWRTLTGASQSETQSRVDGVVGIDYDTFVNASFLLQGRSDEFTRRKPEERKEVLARILNLEKYERLGERAADRERAARAEVEKLEATLARLADVAGLLPAILEEKGALEREVAAREARCAALEARLAGLAERLAALAAEQARCREAEMGVEALRLRRADVEREAAALEKHLADADALLADAADIRARSARYDRLRDEQVRLQALALEDRDLERRLADAAREIERREAAHREKLAALDVEARLLRDGLDALEKDVATRPRLEAEKTRARDAAEKLARETEKLARRDALRLRADALAATIEREKVQRLESLRADAERLDAERRGLPDEDVIEHELSKRAAELEALAALKREFDDVLQQGTDVRDRLRAQEEAVKRLDEQIEKVDGQMARLHDEAENECPTCGTPLTPHHRENVLALLDAERLRFVQQRADALAGSVRAGAERAALLERHGALKARLEKGEAVRVAFTRAEEQKKTRLLRIEEIRVLGERHLQQRRAFEAQAFATLERAELADVQKTLATIEVDEAAIEGLRQAAAGLQSCSTALARVEEAARVLGTRRARLAHIEGERAESERLAASGALLGDWPRQRDALEKERAALGFDADRLARVQADLALLGDVPARRAALDNAEQHRAAWAAQRETRRAEAAALDAEVEALARTAAAWAGLETQRQAAQSEHDAVRADLGAVRDALAAQQQALGALGEKQRAAESARDAHREATAHLHQRRDEAALYRHLRTAFSRKGIPSLIIEQTLPDIEARANSLLERLTDGRMRVRLDTIRDKKTGGTAETLDIYISDEQGVTRAYETFSGGEAFRVNFALRIALSQLLAERSGVRVRTLVVDEGFGTQDAAGVQRLVEAIDTVREDFDKILVVTHLDSLKNAFPVHIEVRKDPVAGSQYQLVGV